MELPRWAGFKGGAGPGHPLSVGHPSPPRFSSCRQVGGGAIIADGGTELFVLLSTFAGNQAGPGNFGGAIYVIVSSARLSSNVFRGNSAVGGGAIFASLGSNLEIDGTW